MSLRNSALTAFFGATGTTAVAAPVVGGQWNSSIDARVEEIRERADRTQLENERLKSQNEILEEEKEKAKQAEKKAKREKKQTQVKLDELNSEFSTKLIKEVEDKLKNPTAIPRGDKNSLFLKFRNRVWDTADEPLINRQKGWTCRNTVWTDDDGESKGIAYCVKEGEKQ